jgi:DNA mismatch repair ATPase MutS
MQKEVLGKSRLIEETGRMNDILEAVSEHSLVLLNESFTSTRRDDGIKLAVYYMDKLRKKRASVGFVTHYYELPELLPNVDITSLVSEIETDGTRSYKVKKSSAGESAHAADIVKKCGMSYEQIIAALAENGGAK